MAEIHPLSAGRGADVKAMLRRHRPVIERWAAIAVPIVVATGVDDVGAAPAAALLSRLANALEGDVTTMLKPHPGVE